MILWRLWECIEAGKQGKQFFFEKKNQKTFGRLSRTLRKEPRQPPKSFLVLFFKKELLALPCFLSGYDETRVKKALLAYL